MYFKIGGSSTVQLYKNSEKKFRGLIVCTIELSVQHQAEVVLV